MANKIEDPPVANDVGSAGSGAVQNAVGGGLGATITPTYLDRPDDIVGVSVHDLRNFKSGSLEEFWQFAVGEFFAAGAFWLGAERMATVQDWKTDPLFLMCVVGFVAGCFIAFFGYRQLSRRKNDIERIIRSATPRTGGSETSATSTTTAT